MWNICADRSAHLMFNETCTSCIKAEGHAYGQTSANGRAQQRAACKTPFLLVLHIWWPWQCRCERLPRWGLHRAHLRHAGRCWLQRARQRHKRRHRVRCRRLVACWTLGGGVLQRQQHARRARQVPHLPPKRIEQHHGPHRRTGMLCGGLSCTHFMIHLGSRPAPEQQSCAPLARQAVVAAHAGCAGLGLGREPLAEGWGRLTAHQAAKGCCAGRASGSCMRLALLHRL